MQLDDRQPKVTPEVRDTITKCIYCYRNGEGIEHQENNRETT